MRGRKGGDAHGSDVPRAPRARGVSAARCGREDRGGGVARRRTRQELSPQEKQRSRAGGRAARLRGADAVRRNSEEARRQRGDGDPDLVARRPRACVPAVRAAAVGALAGRAAIEARVRPLLDGRRLAPLHQHGPHGRGRRLAQAQPHRDEQRQPRLRLGRRLRLQPRGHARRRQGHPRRQGQDGHRPPGPRPGHQHQEGRQ
mmetsp:Transcript_23907/g.73637  ORF Transcript_23907/g.73637 Transcript_23907/m.73637 type:complete len:202 (+) Transcript_23907:3193-3798(+)